ncbi:MAG: primosomal protein N' [Candidatus Erginobacter occultus]|nr:primosomal protein N' [Candidatus Erginobacter occultus]
MTAPNGIASTDLFAEVVLNLPADLYLTYAVPDRLAGRLRVGQKVSAPLGGRRVGGFVVAFPAPPPGKTPRPLSDILEEEPLFGSNLVSLINWVSRYYFSSFARAFKTALPAPVRKNIRAVPIIRAGPALSLEETRSAAAELRKKAPRQAALLERLLAEKSGSLPAAELLRLCGASRSSLTALEKKGLINLTASSRYGAGSGEVLATSPLRLTSEQETAFGAIREAIGEDAFRVFLLHGITGSGKTEIYMQAINQVLDRGKSALVLVPEISLTPQIGDWFRGRFGGRVAIVHSAQAEGERADSWRRIASGEARIVLGPRSAVFAPLADPGLIIVDEEHETSYKQSALSPFYHGRDAAVMRGKLENCPVILGSATPSLESYHNQKAGKYTLLTLRTRPEEAMLPTVKIVDMKAERERQKSAVSFSDLLLTAIKDNLDAGLQTILFLNRRGFFTVLTCPECGYVARCRHCSVSLTYHKKTGRQVCHLCGYFEPPPRACPVCRSRKLVFTGRGTQRIEEQVKKIFPAARVRRMDTDSVGRRDSHREILGEFRAGKIDILVGTQMIAKGLDFPNVTLVGVIMADTALSLADFRATEYTYQILTQVAGRAGRGELKGKVIIQTYSPRHPALLAAVRQEYGNFFEKEMRFREELGYPPLNHFVTLTVLSRNEEKSLRVAEHLARRLHPVLEEGDELLGPAPPPINRLRGYYRHQILIKTKGVVSTLRALRKVLSETGRERDLRVEIDVDPISML